MKKLLAAFLSLFLFGCAAQSQNTRADSAPTIAAEMPKSGDTIVAVSEVMDGMFGYNESSLTKNGNMVSFVALIVFEEPDSKGVIAALGRQEINCLEETDRVDTNVLVNKEGKVVDKGPTDEGFVPIKESSPLRELFEAVCHTKFRRSLEI